MENVEGQAARRFYLSFIIFHLSFVISQKLLTLPRPLSYGHDAGPPPFLVVFLPNCR